MVRALPGGVNSGDTSEPDDDQEPAPDNTTGLGGSFGDPVTSPQNQPETDNDVDVPADSTTGLGGSMGDDPVHQDNEAPSSPDDSGGDSQDGLGVDYTGLPSDPEEDVADAVEDASENSPVVDDVTDDEFTDIQEDHGANPDLPSDVADTVTDAAPNVPTIEVPDVDNPFNSGPLGWLADNAWWAAAGLVGIVVLYLLQPALRILAGVLGE